MVEAWLAMAEMAMLQHFGTTKYEVTHALALGGLGCKTNP